MEDYKKKLKENSMYFKFNNILKTWFILAIFIMFLVCFVFKNIWFTLIMFVISIFLVFIVLLIAINYFYIKETGKKNLKRFWKWKAKLQTLTKIYDKKEKEIFLNYMKENNINSKDKIKLKIDCLKEKMPNLVNLGAGQSFFVIVPTILTIIEMFYDNTIQSVDYDKFIFCASLSIIFIAIYVYCKIYKKLTLDMFFSDKKNLYQKFVDLLTFYYMNFEEYEASLKK